MIPRPLTKRDKQVLPLVAMGFEDREIGRLLNISPVAAESAVKRLKARLGARTRAHAVHLAHLRGLLNGDRP